MQYEISNFAKIGYECRHNIKYWTGEKYIGLGTAAHSYNGDVRYYNTSDINEYINGAERALTPLTREDKISEFIITGLRMNRGISEKMFRERFGIDIKSLYGKEIEKLSFMQLREDVRKLVNLPVNEKTTKEFLKEVLENVGKRT